MTTIGERIATRRRLLKKSLRQVAAEAGISDSQLSRMETGQRGADNRTILHNLARALKCSIGDLTGQPGEPATTGDAVLAGHVHDLLAALVDTDLDDDASAAPRPWEQLDREAALLDDLYRNADHLGVAARLAVFTREVHASTVTAATTPDRERGLRMTVIGASRNSRVLRAVGHRAEAYLAGERAEDAAHELGDPVLLANAYRTRAGDAMSCGSNNRALRLTAKGLAALAGHMDADGAKETAGHLHLRSAMASYTIGRAAEGDAHMDEAAALAEATGDTSTLGLYFGPTNLAFWNLANTIDTGDAERAVHIAQNTNPSLMASADRRGVFHIDAARALALLDNRDSDSAAIRQLLAAERIAPQRLYKTPFAREVLRVILHRMRRNDITSELQGLAERLRITA